jgi:NTE family protein
VVVRPMVAVAAPSSVPTGHGERGSLRDKGMMWVFNQARRIGVQRSVEAAVQRIRDSGKAEVLLLQPQREDGVLAMHTPASYEARRGMLEHSYRQTRGFLARAFAERASALERAGFVQRVSQSMPPPSLTITP